MMRVEIAEAAVAQFEAAQAWWLEHRLSAPGLLESELNGALTRYAVNPRASKRYGRFADLRRLLMPRTRYYLYAVLEPDVVVILSLRHAARMQPTASELYDAARRRREG